MLDFDGAYSVLKQMPDFIFHYGKWFEGSHRDESALELMPAVRSHAEKNRKHGGSGAWAMRRTRMQIMQDLLLRGGFHVSHQGAVLVKPRATNSGKKWRTYG